MAANVAEQRYLAALRVAGLQEGSAK